ncbi:MAG: hypothetical protein ACXW3O_06660 [Brevundimonas sp.]
MRLSILAAALALACAAPAAAQTAPPPPPPPVSAAAPADVATPEAIVAALYEVISGDAGAARDWDRFRSLFHPTGRLAPSGMNREGQGVARSITPQEYVDRSGPMLVEQGFHEREIARRTERFGHIAHVWSTYEALRRLSDPAPFMRGINSIQLFHDGTRWWVISVYWQAETPDAPIPAAYLPPAA